MDITDTAAKAAREPGNAGQVPVAVLCANSRDLEMMPSALSDFSLYGGLYRYVNLVYVPAISLGQVHAQPEFSPNGTVKVKFDATLYNPKSLKSELTLSLRVFRPDGSLMHSSDKKIAA